MRAARQAIARVASSLSPLAGQLINEHSKSVFPDFIRSRWTVPHSTSTWRSLLGVDLVLERPERVDERDKRADERSGSGWNPSCGVEDEQYRAGHGEDCGGHDGLLLLGNACAQVGVSRRVGPHVEAVGVRGSPGRSRVTGVPVRCRYVSGRVIVAERSRNGPLAVGLRTLRRLTGLTNQQIAARAGLNERRVGDWMRGDHVPTADSLKQVLRVLIRAVTEERMAAFPREHARLLDDGESGPWLMWRKTAAVRAESEQADTLTGRRRLNLVSVRECRPEWLGVHPAARYENDDLPVYIRRDHDDELRERLRAVSAEGGFIVVVGSSSVGKTRSLYEAVRDILPDEQILLPANAAAIRAAGGDLSPRTVVWLDDTPAERFLSEPDRGGLARSDLMALLSAHCVVVDTLWPAVHQTLTTLPRAGEVDWHRDAREVLALAGDPIEVRDSLSEAERACAVHQAGTDPRIAEALQDDEFGFTQHLAGAPELTRRWRHADPYTYAVITAAIDARRLGVSTPLSTDLLRAGAVGYIDDRHRATGAKDWFDSAIESATSPGRGGVAPLLPQPGETIGSVAGYGVPDFLEHYGRRDRYFTPMPTTLWNALAEHLTEPRDIRRFGQRAQAHNQFAIAETCYLRAYHAGDSKAERRLIDLLAQQGREEDLRPIADVVYDAQKELARIFYWQGREEELRELAHRTLGADPVGLLAQLVIDAGRIDEAIVEVKCIGDKVRQIPWMDGTINSWLGVIILPQLLWQYGRVEELADLVANGDGPASEAGTEAWHAEGFLMRPPPNRDGTKLEQSESDPGTAASAIAFEALSIKQLKAHAVDGDWEAMNELADVLAKQGLVHDMCVMVAATGNSRAMTRLWSLLRTLGRNDERAALVRYGLNANGTIATG